MTWQERLRKAFTSKKLWGTLLGTVVAIKGREWGLDAVETSRAIWMIFGGVATEGIIDAASAFARGWRGN